MFVAKLDRAEPLKKIVNSFLEIVTNVEWSITKKGLHMYAMDASHVAVMDYMIPASAFAKFSCGDTSGDTNGDTSGDTTGTHICVPFDNLSKVLKCIANDQAVYMHLQAPASHLLLMAGNKKNSVREFKLCLLESAMDSQALQLPQDAEYDLVATFDTGEYATLIKDLASLGDTVTIDSDDRALRFSTSGDIGTANVTFKRIKTRGDGLMGMFSSRYLLGMSRTAQAAEDDTMVEMGLSPSMPVMLKYIVMDGLGIARFYLAPKIVNDDD